MSRVKIDWGLLWLAIAIGLIVFFMMVTADGYLNV